MTAITLILQSVELLCQIKYIKFHKIELTDQDSNISWKIKKVHPLHRPVMLRSQVDNPGVALN